MKKYRVPTRLKYIIGFIFHTKGKAINQCIKDNIPFERIEEFEEEE